MNLLLITIAPVFIILLYVYYRDKYEKEPLNLLIKGLLAGVIIVFPVSYAESFIMDAGKEIFSHPLESALFNAFAVAALCEEGIKLLMVYILIWHNSNFNQKFDGVVYAVFVSLGFALAENFFYVFGGNGGLSTGLMRALTAVPAHAFFGIFMGYYLSMAKFHPLKQIVYLQRAFFAPFIFHGVYDFLLLSANALLLIVFLPFLIFLAFKAHQRMDELSQNELNIFEDNL